MPLKTGDLVRLTYGSFVHSRHELAIVLGFAAGQYSSDVLVLRSSGEVGTFNSYWIRET